MEFEDYCRTCLQVVKDSFAALTDDIYEFLSQDLGLQSVPKEHPKLRLPQSLCSNCFSQIIELQQFLTKCRKVETFFKSKLELLSNQTIEDEEETMVSDEYDETFYAEYIEWTPHDGSTNNVDCEGQEVQNVNDCDTAASIGEYSHSDSESLMEETNMEEKKPSSKIKNKDKTKDCGVCGRRFRSFTKLREHENIHKGIKPYCCDVCGKCFTQKNHLVTHQTLHFGKTVECDECGKKFARNSQLILHDRVHRDEKPFVCDFEDCKAEFRERARLLDHQAYHTGIRKFQCDICGNSFFHKKALGGHMYKVHPKFSYQCDLCFLWFLKPIGIQKHMNSKHKIQLENVQHLKKPINAEKNINSLPEVDEADSQ